MPSQKKEFSYPELSSEQLQLLAYGTFLNLGWTPQYAGPGTLLAYTPRSWNKYADEILIETKDGLLTITSSMVHGESFDLFGRNKKHITKFITVFDTIKSYATDPEWATAIEQLKIQTQETAQQEVKQAEEVTKVMGMTGYRIYITYSIIAINAIVFILMAMNGAGIFEPNGLVHIRWGSNYTPLTLSGEWWRLITNVFIHFGIIHIVMNTYAFYMAGIYLEPMLGKTKYSVAYLCTGVIASIASLWWHKEGVNSAGASGAIFGMYGVFLALLFTNLIPKRTRNSLLQSIGIFVAYNLFYGMRSTGIDNAAHIGGLLSGLVIGFIYYMGLKREGTENLPDRQAGKNPVAVIAIAAATVAFSWVYLNNAKSSVTEAQLQEVKNLKQITGYKDGEKFIEKLNEFATIELKAIAPMNDTTLTNAEMADKLKQGSIAEWDKAADLLASMKDYKISDIDKQRLEILNQYVMLRKEEVSIIEKIATEEKQEDYQQLSALRDKMNGLIIQLGNLK